MLIELLKDHRVLVIGDFMLDSYWRGNVSRISPEAPVAVFQKMQSNSVAGGAANVAANLLAAGLDVKVASIIGDDRKGEQLEQILVKNGCDCSLLIKSKGRKTAEKIRLLAQNNQQLLRVDEEEVEWLRKHEEEQIIEGIEKYIHLIDAIVLSDYMKGMLTESFCHKIIDEAKRNEIPVYCDVKDLNVNKYAGATLVKPNQKELALLTGMPATDKNEIEAACRQLCARCKCEFVLVTLGAQGMALFAKSENTIAFVEAETREVYDVSGAGDTVISYLVACILSGIRMLDAVKYANLAAGIKVGKVGTATVSSDEFEQEVRKKFALDKPVSWKAKHKIQPVRQLIDVVHTCRNKKIVFTNGCFDILHAGHVWYLQKAAEYGDILIVGVNSDASVRKLKGQDRPVNHLQDRLTVLAGLESVSYIVVFEQETPEELIHQIRPDVLVKGAEYKGKFIAGAEFVKANGGEVVLLPMLKDHSTTNIILKSGGYKDGQGEM